MVVGGCGLVGGFLYWCATDWITGYTCYNLIIAFDLTSEEFTQVNLPPRLAHASFSDMKMAKLRESLIVHHRVEGDDRSVIDVWMMKDVVSKSFTKIYTFNFNKPDTVYLDGLPAVVNR